jgi:hypothetical protein
MWCLNVLEPTSRQRERALVQEGLETSLVQRGGAARAMRSRLGRSRLNGSIHRCCGRAEQHESDHFTSARFGKFSPVRPALGTEVPSPRHGVVVHAKLQAALARTFWRTHSPRTSSAFLVGFPVTVHGPGKRRHSERSEESPSNPWPREILRCAQNDRHPVNGCDFPSGRKRRNSSDQGESVIEFGQTRRVNN